MAAENSLTLRELSHFGNDIPNTPSKKHCLPGPITNQQHTTGSNRQDLRTWRRIKVKVVKPDKGVQRGPSCRHTNILQGYPSKKSLRRGYAPSRMRPKTKRWRKVPRLISQRNGVSHPVRNPLLWRGKAAAASTKTHQQLGGFSPNFGAIHIQLQCPYRAEHVKLLILTRSKGRRMERVKCDHLRAKQCGQDLGNVTRPRPQGHFD